jgi:phosphatidylserine decarboxylase
MTIAPITYWNRRAGQLEQEMVYGEGALRWMYETTPGRTLGEGLLSRGWVSALYGALQDTGWSARKVAPFVSKFGIPMEEYEAKRFTSFNDFFIRRFRPGARPFTPHPRELAAFAEARYFAMERLDPAQRFPVKGIALSAAELLGDATLAAPFERGPAFIARLCPVDYHRFHFPDGGRITQSAHRAGPLHSVNPLALQFKPDILVTNERQVSILETDNFGRLAYVEVGATMVGKIVQSHASHASTTRFERGAEKGYFLFGGSTVVVLGEAGAWRPDDDLLEQSLQGRETLVRLGERIAARA